MAELHNLLGTLQEFTYDAGKTGRYYSLPQLEAQGVGRVSRLPVSIRVVLESVLRNYDGQRITENDVRTLAKWKATGERPVVAIWTTAPNTFSPGPSGSASRTLRRTPGRKG